MVGGGAGDEDTPRYFIGAGCYEHTVFGYNVEGLATDSCSLTRVFTAIEHTAPVRTLCSFNNRLVSGGQDDTLKVFDLRKMVVLKSVPFGTAVCMEVFDKTLLIGGDDGLISIWRCRRHEPLF